MHNRKLAILLSFAILSSCELGPVVENKDTHIVMQEKSFEIEIGDIIFQTSTSTQSQAIQLATNSRYSHVGIIITEEGVTYVLEAVQPVKITKLDEWINRGVDEHYVVMRLKEKQHVLTEDEKQEIKALGKTHIGKNYDSLFMWGDEQMYCSELVWKLYNDVLNIKLSELRSLNEFDLSSPLVNSKLKERYGNDIPLNEKVVAPSDIFNSVMLEVLFESQ